MLPFWLAHHKTIFDHGIIIDYRSTDQSVAIVKSICPEWTIQTSRNERFEAAAVDLEVMEIERSLTGIKMALNVTEFLFVQRPLATYFDSIESRVCFRLEALTPISSAVRDSEPLSVEELFAGIEKVVPGQRMGHRFIHNYLDGQYTVGRHTSGLESRQMPDATLLWFGFYPWTDRIIQRKLQIGTQIPASDVRDHYEILKQHTMTADELERKRIELQMDAMADLGECIWSDGYPIAFSNL